jgi:hypothetical protein
MRPGKQCPKCGAVGPMRFGYCEKCRIISPRPLTSHRFASTRRGLLKQAIKVLGFLGGSYSPMKDGCVWVRNRIASTATPLRVAVSDSVRIRESVNASLSPFHGTVMHQFIPGPNAPAGQHRRQV